MTLAVERLIEVRLSEWGLVPDEAALPPSASKNRTLLCKGARGEQVLVKIAGRADNVGVAREGGILKLLAPLASEKNCPLRFPALVAFDPELGLLAVEWLSCSETLHSYHRRTGRYHSSLARQIGRSIGFLHRKSLERPDRFAVQDRFREESDLLECFLRLRPDFYARLSRGGIELFAAVQAHAELVQELQALADRQDAPQGACLLHGDLRQANLLRVPRGRRRDLALVDWELSFWGDPARDLGSLVSDYALGWLLPEHPSEVIRQETLQELVRELLAAYREERGGGFSLKPDFLQRVVQWAGVALLFYVYGMTHYEGELSSRGRRLSEYAAQMAAWPRGWSSKLWGAR